MSPSEFDKTIITDTEQQLQISNRMAVVERQVLSLIDESVDKMYIKGAISEVDSRLTAIESGQKSAMYEVDRRLKALESAIVPECESRIKTMETSLHELGSHFVRYQEDLVGILSKKFQVFVTKMHSQEEKFNVALQEAEAKTKRRMMAEIDSNKDKGSDDGRDPSTRETSSTAASEESDKYGELDKYIELEKVMYVELEKLMCDARKDLEVVSSDLRAHADSTNKRIMALEKGIADAAAMDMPGESQFKPPPLPSFAAKSTKEEVRPMSLKDLEAALQGLTSAVDRSCLNRASSEQLVLEEQNPPVSTPLSLSFGQGISRTPNSVGRSLNRTTSPSSCIQRQSSVPCPQSEAVSNNFDATGEIARMLRSPAVRTRQTLGRQPTPSSRTYPESLSSGTVTSDEQMMPGTRSLTPKSSQRDLSWGQHRTLSADVAKEQRNRQFAKPIASYNVPGKMENCGGSLKAPGRAQENCGPICGGSLKAPVRTANSGPPPSVSERLQGATMPRLGPGICMQTSGFQVNRDASPRVQSARGLNASPMPGTRSSCPMLLLGVGKF